MRQAVPEGPETFDDVVLRTEEAVLSAVELVHTSGLRVQDDEYLACGSPGDAVRIGETEILRVDDPSHAIVSGPDVAIWSGRGAVDRVRVVIRDEQRPRPRVPHDAHGVAGGLLEAQSRTQMTLQAGQEEVAAFPHARVVDP